MDWHGTEQPTDASIAGRGIVEQGVMHILSITSTGGAVLGNRALELDRIQPLLAFHDGMICRGFSPVRKWTTTDGQTIPGLGFWGYDVIQIRANVRFSSVPPR